MTAFQREVEVRLIQNLYLRFHKGSPPVTKVRLEKDAFANTNVSSERFGTAFLSLQNAGYLAEKTFEGTDEKKYCLSPFGIDWLEDYFLFEDTSANSMNFWPRHADTIMIGQRRDRYLAEKAKDALQNKIAVAPMAAHWWTKWGAIAAWLIIPITVLGIIVTIILAKN